MRFDVAIVNALQTNDPEEYLFRNLNDRQWERYEELIEYIEDEVGIYDKREQLEFILEHFIVRPTDSVRHIRSVRRQ